MLDATTRRRLAHATSCIRGSLLLHGLPHPHPPEQPSLPFLLPGVPPPLRSFAPPEQLLPQPFQPAKHAAPGPDRTGKQPAVPSPFSNTQPSPPLSPTNSQRGRPCPKTCHLGPSLLSPALLPCQFSSPSRLPRGPHSSSSHQIIVTISPKPYSTFQYPAKVSARVSKLCESTGNPHTTAARSMYSSFSRGEIIYPGFRSCRQAQQF